MKTAEEILSSLPGFTGSEEWHRWSGLAPLDLLTDGAYFVAEACQAYWLMDAISSWQRDPKVSTEGFQVWELWPPVGDINHWLLSCEDGNDNRVAEQQIEYSDFPLKSIKLFAVWNEIGGITIMLPGEY